MKDEQPLTYIGDSKISSAERDFLLREPSGNTVLSSEEVLEMARRANETHELFYRWIKPRMNVQRARRVQQMRCSDGWSYRTIAGLSYLEWGADGTWAPLNNQLAGMALCEAAAELLGEDVQSWPWQANQA
jgi:hypothetical protein